MAGRLNASPPWWHNRRLVPWLVQGAVGLVLVVVIAFLLGNLVRNLSAAGLLLSWRWLGQNSRTHTTYWASHRNGHAPNAYLGYHVY